MFKSHFTNGNAAQKFICKNYLNKLTKIKAMSKSIFYKKELSKNKNDLKKVWNLIHFLIPPNKKSFNSTNQEVNLNLGMCRIPDTGYIYIRYPALSGAF